MIRKILSHNIFAALLLLWLLPFSVNAQGAVTLSISPTLYDMSAEPGQTWSSTLKVVNVNDFDLTVYAEVVNFTPHGEGGDGRFISIDPATAEGVTLAEWFVMSREPITIPREQTIEIPFTVKVPIDASPGGHFAAIMVGTKPIQNEPGQARLQTAQMVTSLFFARVAGDVVELGGIREFSTTKTLLARPEATFSLRFENKGNVHLQPRGEIRIYNMWGEERGIIPINQYTSFGNVLPDSVRKFLFTWKGEWSVSDIGRYTAVATLGYGSEEKQFSTSKTIFWVLPITLLVSVVVGLALFVGLLTWLVRVYVRHMLRIAGVDIESYAAVQNRVQRPRPTIHAPVRAGILDLTQRMNASTTLLERAYQVWRFLCAYKLFFLAVVLISVFVVILVWYVRSANTEQRGYEVTYLQNESTPTRSVSSEEIMYTQMTNASGTAADDGNAKYKATLSIVNRSGSAGAGATLRIELEAAQYKVISLEADLDTTQERTVIVATNDRYTEALGLSEKLKNAPVSLIEEFSTSSITVFIGSDVTLQ